jgi:hypothetical protein
MRLGIGMPLTQPKQLPFLLAGLQVLRKYGTNAHVYLPGIGVVNGINAANYLDSAGTTAATVDNPVGLALDAVRGAVLGSETIVNGDFSSGTTGWTLGTGWSIGGGQASKTAGTGSYLENPASNPASVGQMVQVVFTVSAMTAGQVQITYGAANGPAITSNGTYTHYVIAAATGASTGYWASFFATSTFDGKLSNISVKQVPGTHATQSTTANKPILRYANGRYSHEYNGSTNYLALGAPLFQMTDDFTIIAGVTPTGGAGTARTIFAQSNASGDSLPVLAVGVANNFITYISGGGATIGPTVGSAPLNTPSVVSVVKTGLNVSVRQNEGAPSTTAVSGTYNAATTAGLGANMRPTNTEFMFGKQALLIAIKATVTDADRLTLARFVGANTDSGVSF